jgi:hypothetical protein
MDAVNDFKSIRRKLERQEQKAEFEARTHPRRLGIRSPSFGRPMAGTPGEAVLNPLGSGDQKPGQND